MYNDLMKKFEKGGGKQSFATGDQPPPRKPINNFMNNESDTAHINHSQGPKGQQSDNSHYVEEIKRLKMLIQQRDNEIMILLNLINKNKSTSEGVQLSLPVHRDQEASKMGSFDNKENMNQSNTDTGGNLMSSFIRESRPLVFPSEDEILK